MNPVCLGLGDLDWTYFLVSESPLGLECSFPQQQQLRGLSSSCVHATHIISVSSLGNAMQ